MGSTNYSIANLHNLTYTTLDGMSDAVFFQQGNQTGIFAAQLCALLLLVSKLFVE